MKVITLLFAAILALPLAAQRPDPAQAALKAAIDKEVADGDLKAAIALYSKVAANHKANKSVAAQALVRMGQCYEKLGDAEARKAYERALREFPGEADSAALARARLAALGRALIGSNAMSAQLLFREPSIRIALSRIAADGKTLPYFGADGNLFVRDLRSGVSRQLTFRSNPEISGFAWVPVSSRDGSRIAYGWTVSQNHYELRVIPSAGGTPRMIPLKLGPDRGFVNPWDWSPDGRHLAVWAATRNPDTWNVGIVDVESGELRSLSPPRSGRCERGTFSADGRLLLASCRPDEKSTWNLAVIDVATGVETPILGGSANDRYPIWLSASGRIAFVSDRSGKNALYLTEYRNGAGTPPALVSADIGDSILLGAGEDGALYYGRQETSQDIFLANVDPHSLRVQGSPVRVVDDNLGHNSAPKWSPSGTSFGYASARDRNGGSHVVIRAAGEREVIVSDPLRWSRWPTWCGESRVLVWGTPHANTRRLYDARTGAIVQPDMKIEGLKAPYQLAYSSDCGSVFVSSYSRDTMRRRIYRIDLNSKTQTELHTDDADWSLAPAVSPDGRWLALVGRQVKGGAIGLLLLPASGGAPRMLAPGADDNFLTWSPDSKHVFFVRNSGDQQEFVAAPVDGSPLKPTGIRGSGIIGPSLHPDGKRVLFSVAASTSEVWSLRNFQTK